MTEQVVFAPALPYEEALQEMLRVDGLVIFQGYTSNPAIPAKLYEYFRAQRPILALVDDDGETAHLIRKESAGVIAPLDDVGLIATALAKILDDIEGGNPMLIAADRVSSFERAHAVSSFARLFDEVVALGSHPPPLRSAQ